MLITIKEIYEKNPLYVKAVSDSYYAKLANQIYRQLKKADMPMNIRRNSLREIAIKSVKYFEDVISQFGIWATFRNLHNSLYGKKLPFYDVDESEYIDDEINIEDVKYIVWSTIIETNDNIMLNPHAPAIEDMAMMIYSVLDDEFENAPINDELLDVMCEPSQYDDFMKVKFLLSWFLIDCYLTSKIDTLDYIQEVADEYVENTGRDERLCFYNAMSHCSVTYKTGPLALLPQQWMAALLDYHEMHSQADVLRTIEGVNVASFLLKERKESTIVVESVDSKIYEVELHSFAQEGLEKVVSRPVLIMQLAKYGATWLLNGFCIPIDEDQIHKEDVERWKKYTENKKITTRFYEEKARGKKMLFFAGYEVFQQWIGIPSQSSSDFDDVKKAKHIMLFLDEKNDPTIIYKNIEAIYSPDNPFYDEQYATKHALELLFPDFSPSGELVSYLANNGMLKDASIKTNKGRNKEIVQKNIDFLTRFLQRGDYFDISEM